MRSASKRTRTFLQGVALGAAVAMVTLVASAAVAGTGIGQVFNLGTENRVNARSELSGDTPKAMLKVTNESSSGSATGLAIHVHAGRPPLVVNSSTKVKDLDADLLDGRDGSDFQAATSKTCAHGTAISSIAANGTTSCNSPAVPRSYWASSISRGFRCLKH